MKITPEVLIELSDEGYNLTIEPNIFVGYTGVGSPFSIVTSEDIRNCKTLEQLRNLCRTRKAQAGLQKSAIVKAFEEIEPFEPTSIKTPLVYK